MAVRYEWDVEVQTAAASDDYEEGEVIDHLFCKSFIGAMTTAAIDAGEDLKHVIVLVRDDDNQRSWAYLEDGKLPTHFEDAYQNQHGKVPQRFHAEVAAA